MHKDKMEALMAEYPRFSDLIALHRELAELRDADKTPDSVRELADMLHDQGDEVYQLFMGEATLYGGFDDKYGPGTYYDMVNNMTQDYNNIVADFTDGDSGDYLLTASDYYKLADRLFSFTIRINETVACTVDPSSIRRQCIDIAEEIDPKLLPANWRESIHIANKQLDDTAIKLNKKYGDDPECGIIKATELMRQVARELDRIANMNPDNISGRRDGLEERTQGYIHRMCRLAANYEGKVEYIYFDPAYDKLAEPYRNAPHQRIDAIISLAIDLANDMWGDWTLDIDPNLIEEVEPIMVRQEYLDEYSAD